MENSRALKITKNLFVFLAIFAFGFFVFSQNGKGYDDKTTHPGLTDEMVDFYNASFNTKLTNEEKEWIVQGSIDEDTPPRWINHFYDPIHNEGWKAENLGTVSPSTLRFFSNVFFNVNTEIVSSKQWVHNEFLQARYVSYGGNNTWENAVRQYINGNKKEAYYILGHVLHLLEDKTVPDHTRNDTHAHEGSSISGDGGSPYEDYGKNFNRQNLTTAQDLQKNGRQPIFLSSIDEYLEHLARYSNGYFFSEHTIDSQKYSNPKSVREDESYRYGKDKNGKEFALVRINYSTDERLNKIKTYTLRDDEGKDLVLSSYFSRLTQEAVMSGAGAIKLFHEEAEKAAKNKSSISSAPKVNWLQQMRSPLYGGIALFNDFNGFIQKTSSAISGILNNLQASFSSSLALVVGIGNTQPQPQTVAVIQQTPALTPAPTSMPTPESTPPAADTPQQVQESVIPAPQAVEEVEAPVSEEKTGEEEMQAPVDNVVVAPVPDIISPPVPVFRGSGSVTGISPDALVAQNNPAPQSQTESADTGAFSTSTEEVFLEEIATTTDSAATSTEEVIDDTATTTDPVITDATSTEPILPVPPAPMTDFKDSIVINEVAWMGTKAQANDEWIELYNKTDQDIDLSGWTLENKNKTFSVALAHSISARGYFLLERTASSTTDGVEDMIFTGALNNSGPNANLYLKNGTTIIDNIDFGWQWPAGDNGKRYTMERVSAYATSTMSANWKTYDDPDTVPFAKDAKGDDIYGTPGRKNSVSGFYTPTENITENTTWHKEQSPYFVSTNIIVGDGATLTIEPGVVVKFAKGTPYGGGMDVRGAVIAEGLPADPIVFTSFLDDAADSIDSNRDASATSPAAGDWMSIIYTNESEVSVIRSAHIRYGGQGKNHNPNGWTPTFKGVISAQGGMLEISDSNIENNRAIAIYASNGSRPKIQRNVIHDTAQNMYAGGLPLGIGVYINTDASAEIIGNTIKNNSVGIASASVTDAFVIVKDTIFDNNIKNGEFFKGYVNWNLENSGNTDTRNKGGFYIKIIVAEGQVKVLRADTMPYIVVGGITVEEGGSLEIEPGVVVKNAPVDGSQPIPIVIRGVLKSRGAEDHPIVFTSFDDDADGYDSDGSATDPVPGRWKNIVFIGSASSDSLMEYTRIRYGGQGKDVCPYAYLGGPCMEYYGAMRIDGADPKITHVILENNLAIAVFTEGFANPTIENSIIRDTKEAIKNSMAMMGGYGISIGPDSEPTIADTTYANNTEDVVYRE